MNRIKVWPHITIMAGVVALIAAVGVGFWMKHEQTAFAEELPYAARIQRVDGDVAFSDSLPNTDAANPNAEWIAATPNQPFSEGDRIYTRDNSHASLAFSGRNFARLDSNTSLDVVSLGDRRTQLALRDGSAMFEVGHLERNELFEVATPYGAINFDQPGLYNLAFDNNGGVLVAVLSGLARVVGQTGSGEVSKGEMLTLVGQAAAELALSRLNGQDAGNQVDDYYRDQYPNSYDGRYNNYDAYLSDPYYYDPYRRNASYQYASSTIPGINDLDYYGDWQNVAGYGNAWRPRVDAGWVPYQQGQWTNDYPYGQIDLPPGIAKKLRDTPVYVSGDIRESASRKDLARSMRVERVSDNARNQKFKVRDERKESQQVDHARKQEIERPDVEAKRGDKKAQQQVRQLEQLQKIETSAEGRTQKATQTKAQRKAQRQPQGEQVGNPAKQQSNGSSKQGRKQSPPKGGQIPSQPEKAKSKGKGKP